jgi:hypothetical protein
MASGPRQQPLWHADGRATGTSPVTVKVDGGGSAQCSLMSVMGKEVMDSHG